MSEPMLIAKNGDIECLLLPEMCNRHGLVTGATGTGKTVTLQVVTEHLSRLGVPTFMADVKSDMSGMSQPGKTSPKFEERLKLLGVEAPAFTGLPTVFWDVYGEQGHPIRATVSDMGPLLLGRILNLNETQEGVLTLAFKVADDNGLLLLDLKDLRALLQFVGENARTFTTNYGNVSAASVGAIQRGLLALEQQGAARFLGEPMLNVDDLLQTGDGGRGNVNILAAEKLMQSPKVYSTLLLWLLSELYERLPEVGDRDKPKLVFSSMRRTSCSPMRRARCSKNRAGRPSHSVQGRGRLLRHPESARYPGDGGRSARQSRAARVARLYAARSEGGEGGGGNHARQSQIQHRDRDHRARRGRGAGFVPGRERPSRRRRARVHSPPRAAWDRRRRTNAKQ